MSSLLRFKFFSACLLCFTMTSGAFATGGMEGGGGNLYEGRPLESYIGDVKKTTAFIQKVEPLLASLKKSGNSPVINLLTTSLRKSWFFIPGKLNTLPADRIGSAVPTEQVALQDFKEVWIDSKSFNTMGLDDQGKLILHEMLMGLRLLKLNSRYEQCLAIGASIADCDRNDKHALSPRDLQTSDYADIRSTVNEISQGHFEKTDDETWQDLLARHNFSNSFYIFRLKSDKRYTTAQELLVDIQASILTNDLPQYGFSSNHVKESVDKNAELAFSDESCRFDIAVDLKAKKFILTDKAAGSETTFVLDRATYNRDVFPLNDKLAYVSNFADKTLRTLGEQNTSVLLYFNTSGLIGFYTSKFVLVGDELEPYEEQIKGSNYLCLKQNFVKIMK